MIRATQSCAMVAVVILALFAVTGVHAQTPPASLTPALPSPTNTPGPSPAPSLPPPIVPGETVVPGGPPSFVPTPKGNPTTVTILLVDYQHNFAFLDRTRIIGPDASGPCNFTLVLATKQTSELAATGETQLTVPALCPNVEMRHFELVNQPVRQGCSNPNGCLRKEVVEASLPLTLEGLVYRSPSLKPIESGPLARLPSTGAAGSGRAFPVAIVVMLSALVGVAALSLALPRLRRR